MRKLDIFHYSFLYNFANIYIHLDKVWAKFLVSCSLFPEKQKNKQDDNDEHHCPIHLVLLLSEALDDP